jgi:prevent-host-death family protein
MPSTVNLYDAKTHLSQLVDRAARGEEIIIAKAGKPRARLVPLCATEEPRKPANLLGVTFVADDFDDPLPPEILSEFEAEK